MFKKPIEIEEFSRILSSIPEVSLMVIPRHGLAIFGWAISVVTALVPGLNAQINPEAFRRTIDGSPVDLYTLTNSNGLEATITNYRLPTPDWPLSRNAALSRFTKQPGLSHGRAAGG